MMGGRKEISGNGTANSNAMRTFPRFDLPSESSRQSRARPNTIQRVPSSCQVKELALLDVLGTPLIPSAMGQLPDDLFLVIFAILAPNDALFDHVLSWRNYGSCYVTSPAEHPRYADERNPWLGLSTERLSTLRTLSYVCKRFRELTEPLRWVHVTLHGSTTSSSEKALAYPQLRRRHTRRLTIRMTPLDPWQDGGPFPFVSLMSSFRKVEVVTIIFMDHRGVSNSNPSSL